MKRRHRRQLGLPRAFQNFLEANISYSSCPMANDFVWLVAPRSPRPRTWDAWVRKILCGFFFSAHSSLGILSTVHLFFSLLASRSNGKSCDYFARVALVLDRFCKSVSGDLLSALAREPLGDFHFACLAPCAAWRPCFFAATDNAVVNGFAPHRWRRARMGCSSVATPLPSPIAEARFGAAHVAVAAAGLVLCRAAAPLPSPWTLARSSRRPFLFGVDRCARFCSVRTTPPLPAFFGLRTSPPVPVCLVAPRLHPHPLFVLMLVLWCRFRAGGRGGGRGWHGHRRRVRVFDVQGSCPHSCGAKAADGIDRSIGAGWSTAALGAAGRGLRGPCLSSASRGRHWQDCQTLQCSWWRVRRVAGVDGCGAGCRRPWNGSRWRPLPILHPKKRVADLWRRAARGGGGAII